jgi:hypothetical protein
MDTRKKKLLYHSFLFYVISLIKNVMNKVPVYFFFLFYIWINSLAITIGFVFDRKCSIFFVFMRYNRITGSVYF